MHLLVHDKNAGTRRVHIDSEGAAGQWIQDLCRERVASTTGFTMVNAKGSALQLDGSGAYLFTIDAADLASKNMTSAGCACAACVFNILRHGCLVCGHEASAKLPLCDHCARDITQADWAASMKLSKDVHGLLWAVHRVVDGDKYRSGGHVSIKTFHADRGKRVAKAMLGQIGAKVVSVTHCAGGSAVAGEVCAKGMYDDDNGIEITLYGHDILSPQPDGPNLMYRRLLRNPRYPKNFDTGTNQWMPYRRLARFSEACQIMKRNTQE